MVDETDFESLIDWRKLRSTTMLKVPFSAFAGLISVAARMPLMVTLDKTPFVIVASAAEYVKDRHSALWNATGCPDTEDPTVELTKLLKSEIDTGATFNHPHLFFYTRTERLLDQKEQLVREGLIITRPVNTGYATWDLYKQVLTTYNPGIVHVMRRGIYNKRARRAAIISRVKRAQERADKGLTGPYVIKEQEHD